MKDNLIVKEASKGHDDWIFVLEEYFDIFLALKHILEHNSGYPDYKNIALEIGIGIIESNDVIINQNGSIFNEELIRILKTNLTHYYRQYYRLLHNSSIKETFLVVTEEMYDYLEPFDKSHCEFIEYKSLNNTIHRFYSYDIEKMIQRGKLYTFLNLIGYHPGSKTLNRIDEHFIPPTEYDRIVNLLQDKRMVFLVGPPEVGKTYTAVRLLWEFYDKMSYSPTWIRGGERFSRRDVRTQLEEIKTVISPQSIIYFEDPFGKIQYEERESLERNFRVIFKEIQNTPDAFVIITSREEVYKEFKARSLVMLDFSPLEIIINLRTYGQNERKGLIHGWGRIHQCQWQTNERLVNIMMKKLQNPKILPTPLTIRNFVISTINTTDEGVFKSEIIHNSQETIQSFAADIQEMSLDKILFLCLIYSEDFPIDLLEDEYHRLVEYFEIKEAWEFEKLFKWFIRDKIEISQDIEFSKVIGYSHPSYYDAFASCLVEKSGLPSRINSDIYSKILVKWSENKETASLTIDNILFDFNRLDIDISNEILLNLSRNHKESSTLMLIIKFYSYLTNETKESIFYLIQDSKIASEFVTLLEIESNLTLLKNLPSKVFNNLFYELSLSIDTEALDNFLYLVFTIPELSVQDYRQTFLEVKDIELIMYIIAHILHISPNLVVFLNGNLIGHSLNFLFESANHWLQTNFGGARMNKWEFAHVRKEISNISFENFIAEHGKIMSKIKAKTILWLLLWLNEGNFLADYILPDNIVPNVKFYLDPLNEITIEYKFKEKSRNQIFNLFTKLI